MVPIPTEALTRLMQSGWKRKFTGRNQCVLSSCNVTPHISLNGYHFSYVPQTRIALQTAAAQMLLHLINGYLHEEIQSS